MLPTRGHFLLIAVGVFDFGMLNFGGLIEIFHAYIQIIQASYRHFRTAERR
jgi:hypothetical protein